MKWSQREIERLSPILDQIQTDLEPLAGKSILVLCSAAGDVAFRLAEKVKRGKVVGLELDQSLLEVARRSAKSKGFENVVEFLPAEKTRIPAPDRSFDGLVSEFIVFPTPTPTQIGQPEMARVLRPGGRMVITDVIVTQPVPQAVRDELQAIGLDYLCEGTADDFRGWMTEAGLTGIQVADFTPAVRQVWEQRRNSDTSPQRQKGYALLLEDSAFRLGEAIFYIYVGGAKPAA